MGLCIETCRLRYAWLEIFGMFGRVEIGLENLDLVRGRDLALKAKHVELESVTLVEYVTVRIMYTY